MTTRRIQAKANLSAEAKKAAEEARLAAYKDKLREIDMVGAMVIERHDRSNWRTCFN